MKQPMKSRDVLPKNVPGVGWGVSCRGRVGYIGVEWGGVCHAGWGGVGHVGVGVGHAGVGWVM